MGAILRAAAASVGTASAMAASGAFLRWEGTMTAQVSKGLSKISMTCTMPCLLFASAIGCRGVAVVEECPPLRDMLEWPLLVLPFLYVFVGLVVGSAAARVGRMRPEFRRAATASVAFGNSTGLPITLLGVINSQAGVAPMFGRDTGLNLTYLATYLLIYPVLQWSVGGSLLQRRGGAPGGEVDEPRRTGRALSLADAAAGEQPDEGAPPPPRPMLRLQRSLSRASLSLGGELRRSAHLLSQPEPPIASLHTSPAEAARERSRRFSIGPRRCWSSSDVGEDAERAAAAWAAAAAASAAQPPLDAPSPLQTLSTALQRVLPPPVLGALAGMCVALTAGGGAYSPRAWLLAECPGEAECDAPLEWLFAAVDGVGRAAVPLNMMILGNRLAQGMAATDVSWRALGTLTAAKMVVMPAFGAATGIALRSSGLVRHPAALLVAMIVTCTPTANNVMVRLSRTEGRADAPPLLSALFA